MAKLNNVQVLELINNNLEYAIKATENSFRAKCFVVLEGDRIEYFAKTKRGAEGYIKKHTFSYYDESIMEMRHAGSNSYIVEICALDIVDYYNTSNIWFTTLKKRWSIGQRNDYMLQQAQEMNVSSEVLKVVEFILANSDYNSFPSYEMVFGTPKQVEQVEENETTENLVVVESAEIPSQNIETIQETQTNTIDSIDVKMILNESKNGIELYFNDKPSEDVRNLLKSNGYRWHGGKMCWYARQNEKTIQLGEQLSNSNVNESESIETVSTPDIQATYEQVELVDVTQFKINEATEKRLIDNSFINNGKYVGMYTKQLQDTLSRLKNDTIAILETTNNDYYQYKLSTAFNSFCDRYSKEMESYYYQSSINPSWAVTGRGGLNISRYNKKQEQIHNKLGKTIEIVEKFESMLKKYKSKISKDKQLQQLQAVNNAIENNTLSITFTTSERTATVAGYTETKRAYISPNYFIMKSWGCFRIFDNKTCKEVHSMKTTERLQDAKNYVTYLESLLINESQVV